jgi:hypothetical protein
MSVDVNLSSVEPPDENAVLADASDAEPLARLFWIPGTETVR